jgi:hypothetical protein
MADTRKDDDKKKPEPAPAPDIFQDPEPSDDAAKEIGEEGEPPGGGHFA